MNGIRKQTVCGKYLQIYCKNCIVNCYANKKNFTPEAFEATSKFARVFEEARLPFPGVLW
jgi:hypothetical protein